MKVLLACHVAPGLEAVASAYTAATPKVHSVKTAASSSNSGCNWEAYADNYFDGEFEAPFSESEEEEEVEEKEMEKEEENDEAQTVLTKSSGSHEVERVNSLVQEDSSQACKPSEPNLLQPVESLATLAAPQDDPPSIAHGHSPSSSPRSDRSSEQQEQNER